MTFGIPKNFEAIYADIRKLAAAVGEQVKGEAIVQNMQAELVNLKPKGDRLIFAKGTGTFLSKRSQSPEAMPVPLRAIFFQSGGLVPGSGTFENSIMDAAGLENLAATAGIRDYGSLSLEQLVEMKPDVLIFSSEQKQKPTIRGEVLSHPAIRKALPKVKIVVIPSSVLKCGSPASIEAVRILVRETRTV